MQLNDKEAIQKIVVGMSTAQTVAELTKTWSSDIVWFDTINCAVKGRMAVLEEYGKQFVALQDIKIEILDITIQADEKFGFAYSVQHFKSTGVNGGSDFSFTFRETDCFAKRDGEWRLVHQHVSLPIDFSTGKAVLESDFKA